MNLISSVEMFAFSKAVSILGSV